MEPSFRGRLIRMAVMLLLLGPALSPPQAARSAPPLRPDAADSPPPAHWLRSYQGELGQSLNAVRPASDGSLYAGGQTWGAGYGDAWILRTDSSGRILWQKAWAGEELETVMAAAELAGGDVLAAVWARTPFGASPGATWLVRLTPAGGVVWAFTLDGLEPGTTNALLSLEDGGALFAGDTGADFILLEIDGSGRIEWQRSYGGAGRKRAGGVIRSGEGFLAAGSGRSLGRVAPSDADSPWLFRTDRTGRLIWQRALDGPDVEAERWSEERVAVAADADGGAFIAATFMQGWRQTDLLVARWDADGRLLWQRRLGGSQKDYGSDAAATKDGGLVVGGSTRSFGAGYEDVWIVRLDAGGGLIWQAAVGGASGDRCLGLQVAHDGAAIGAGDSFSWARSPADAFLIRIPIDGRMCLPVVLPYSDPTIPGWEALVTAESSATPGYAAKPLMLAAAPAPPVENLVCGTPLFDLKLEATPGGSTDPAPGVHSFAPESAVSVLAVPYENHEFDGWSGDVAAGRELENPLALTIASPLSIKASFRRVIYPPLHPRGWRTRLGRSPGLTGTDVLAWEDDPRNAAVAFTRIYRAEDAGAFHLLDLPAGRSMFLQPKVPLLERRTYILAFVDDTGREGLRIEVVVGPPPGASN